MAAELRVAVLDLPRSLDLHPPSADVAAMPMDATDPAAVKRSFATLGKNWGGLDALVFLVGFTLTPPPGLEDVAPEAWDEVLDGNLKSAFLCATAALPLLRAAGGGP